VITSRATPPLSLVIVAPVRLYREALANTLSVPPFVVAASVARVSEALPVVEETRPHVVAIDPRDASLCDFHEIRRLSPGTRIVAIAVSDDTDVLPYAEAGICGYVPADASLNDLILVIHDAMKGEMRCSPRLAGSLLRRLWSLAPATAAASPHTVLTCREQEIAALIGKGLSNKDIAVRLHIEVATVKNHVHHVLEKLQVHSRAQALTRLRQGAGGSSLSID
jgi:two-component system, NarL family, nitrate/nitrite response regulator NarL